jgi:integrase
MLKYETIETNRKVFENITVGKLISQLKKASEKAGLRHFRLHDMRHSACVVLLNRGKAEKKKLKEDSNKILPHNYNIPQKAVKGPDKIRSFMLSRKNQ